MPADWSHQRSLACCSADSDAGCGHTTSSHGRAPAMSCLLDPLPPRLEARSEIPKLRLLWHRPLLGWPAGGIEHKYGPSPSPFYGRSLGYRAPRTLISARWTKHCRHSQRTMLSGNHTEPGRNLMLYVRSGRPTPAGSHPSQVRLPRRNVGKTDLSRRIRHQPLWATSQPGTFRRWSAISTNNERKPDIVPAHSIR